MLIVTGRASPGLDHRLYCITGVLRLSIKETAYDAAARTIGGRDDTGGATGIAIPVDNESLKNVFLGARHEASFSEGTPEHEAAERSKRSYQL